MKKIDLYVLNEFTKHDRKIFGIKGMSFGRPIRLKSVLYFLGFFVGLLIIRFIPIVGFPLKHIPVVFHLMIPIGITYLLTDLNTENRNPIQYLKAMLLYGVRRVQGYSYYRGKKLKRQRNYKFTSYIEGGYLTYKEPTKGGTKHGSKF